MPGQEGGQGGGVGFSDGDGSVFRGGEVGTSVGVGVGVGFRGAWLICASGGMVPITGTVVGSMDGVVIAAPGTSAVGVVGSSVTTAEGTRLPDPPAAEVPSSGPVGHQITAASAVIATTAPPATAAVRPVPCGGPAGTGTAVAAGGAMGIPAWASAAAARSLSSSGATASGTAANSCSGLVCREISRRHWLQSR